MTSKQYTGQRRFAITATDRYLGVFDAFVRHGWEPIKLFTTQTDELTNSNRAVIARATKLKAEIQLSRLDEAALRGLAASGCDLLVVASYSWRIGAWQAFLPHAVNFHPSPLPHYRGPYPLVPALLDGQTRWGTTCHKLASDFDTGDVLAQRLFDISEDECHETLDLKTQMATEALADEVASDFDTLWSTAQSQETGSYAAMWSSEDRQLDFERTSAELSKQLRAFGRFGCTARLYGKTVNVSLAKTWVQAHRCPLGSVAHTYGLNTVIACRDGFVALLDWRFT